MPSPRQHFVSSNTQTRIHAYTHTHSEGHTTFPCATKHSSAALQGHWNLLPHKIQEPTKGTWAWVPGCLLAPCTCPPCDLRVHLVLAWFPSWLPLALDLLLAWVLDCLECVTVSCLLAGLWRELPSLSKAITLVGARLSERQRCDRNT